MPSPPSRGSRLPSSLAWGLSLAIAFFGRSMDPVAAGRPESSPGGSLYLEPLRFADDAGTPLELSTFQGRQVILTMFYARCRSTCPATLGKLRQIDKAFAERGRPIEIVLVSYDSDFDRPKRLARFRDREKLPPQWRLLSGACSPAVPTRSNGLPSASGWGATWTWETTSSMATASSSSTRREW